MSGNKRRSKTKVVVRAARVCQWCEMKDTLKTYKSMKIGNVRISWARCSKCKRVTKEYQDI